VVDVRQHMARKQIGLARVGIARQDKSIDARRAIGVSLAST
jgi:hypothetical protein